MRLIVIALITLSTMFSAYGQSTAAETEREIDSICSLLPYLKLDTVKLAAEHRIVLLHPDVDSTLKYSKIMLADAKALHNARYQTFAYDAMAWAYYYNDDYKSTIDCMYHMLPIADSIGDKRMEMRAYAKLGSSYYMLSDPETAIRFHKKSIALALERKDTAGLSQYYTNIAHEYFEGGMYEESREYYQKVNHIDSLSGNEDRYERNKLNLGSTIWKDAIRKLDYARFREGKRMMLEAMEAIPIHSYISTRNFTPNIFFDEINYFLPGAKRRRELLDSCCHYLQILSANKYNTRLQRFYLTLKYAQYNTLAGNYQKTQCILDSMCPGQKYDINDPNAELICDQYIQLYRAMGDAQNLVEHHEKKIAILQRSGKKILVDSGKLMAQVEYENILREREKEALKKEVALENKAYWRNVLILLLLAIGGLIVRGYVRGRKTNRQLNLQNDLLKEQQEEIVTQNENLEGQKKMMSLKNRQITDSINYASLIQRATLPSDAQMSVLFPENFVIYKPLNIVSGDFYWGMKVGRYKMIAVADCTGHGVPGAFVSMLCISLLTDISKSIAAEADMISAASVLDRLRTDFKAALHQQGGKNDNRDGVDMALAIIDTTDLSMHYAGAFRPLVIFREKQMSVLEADRMPIGVYHKEKNNFTDNTYQLKEGDSLYMFSDGMTDQFGIDEDGSIRKFSRRRLVQLLSEVQSLPFEEQKREIEESMNKWRDDGEGLLYEQTDDAILVAVKI